MSNFKGFTVHNFFLDLTLAIYRYLKDIIPTEIHGIETNLGNPGLQLEHTGNYLLPRIQIDLQDLEPNNTRPVTYQFLHKDVFGRTALQNFSNDIRIKTQEDWEVFNFEVRINCDSHLQALDIKHHLNFQLPIGKLLNHFKFTSFFKIPDFLFQNGLIKETDNVYNLYKKFFDTNGNSEYCFALDFEPLVRPNAIVLDIGDNNSQSFTVNISLEVQSSMITHIIFPWLNNYTEEFEKIDIINRKNIPVHPYKSKLNKQIFIKNIRTSEVKIELIDDQFINTNHEFWFGKLVGQFLDHLFLSDFKFLDDEIITGKLEISIVNNELTNGIIKGERIDGRIYNIDRIGDNQFKLLFDGILNEKQQIKTITLYIENESNSRLFKDIATVNSNWIVKSVIDYNPGEITNNIPDINKFRCRINEIELISYNGMILDNSITSVNGRIDEYGLEFDLNNGKLNKYNDDFNEMIINVKLDKYSNYGLGYINAIAIDVNDINRNVIAGTMDIQADNSGGYNNIYSRIDSLFNKTTREFEIYFDAPVYFDSSTEWQIIIPHSKFKATSNDKILTVDLNIQLNNKIKFKIPELIYHKHFNDVSKINPLFYYIKK